MSSHTLKQASLIPVSDLSVVYPNIKDELYSRHSMLLCKLSNVFKGIYSDIEPSHYSVVKGKVQLLESIPLRLEFALENGATVLLSNICNSALLFINGSHFNEQIVFTADGKLSQGASTSAGRISQIIQLANQDLPLSKLQGGLLYVHMNIALNSFNYHQCMYMALFIAISTLNQTIQNYTIEELIQKMASLQFMGSYDSIRTYFQYQHCMLNLKVEQDSMLLPLLPKYRFVLCQLPINKPHNLQEDVLRKILDYKELDSIYQLSQEEISLLPEQEHRNYATKAYHQLNLLRQLSNEVIDIQQFVERQRESQTDESVREIIQKIGQAAGTKSCMLVNGEYALIVSDQHKSLEVLRKVKACIKGMMEEEGITGLQMRFGSEKKLGEKIFTSAPSQGVALLKPKGELWFG